MNIQEWVRLNHRPTDFAIVTGSTSGIGKIYAEELAKLGCNLICVSNEETALIDCKQKWESLYGIKVTNYNLDLRDCDRTIALSESLPADHISILINNAGFGLKGTFETNPAKIYADIIKVNSIAPVVLARAILPSMQKKNSGLCIHISSINSLLPIPKNQVYTATKAFLTSYSLAMSRENKRTNINFQLVLPGTTKTPFHDRQGAKPARMTMTPEAVVQYSFADVKRKICIPNPGDRILARLIPFLPMDFKMDLAAYILAKRLGI
jgi:short-subunit dehydrogenase